MFDIEKTEKDIMNLFGLVTAIKSSAENVSSGDDEENIEKHTESVAQLCDIASEKLSAVWANVSDIETANDESESETVSSGESKPLAVIIAELLAHSEIPNELFDSVVEGLDEVADVGRFKSLRKLESSPEYISKILSDYAEVESN